MLCGVPCMQVLVPAEVLQHRTGSEPVRGSWAHKLLIEGHQRGTSVAGAACMPCPES